MISSRDVPEPGPTPSPTGRGSPRSALRRERGTGEHSAERRGEGSRPSEVHVPTVVEKAPHPGSSALNASELIHSTLYCALQSPPSPVGRGWGRSALGVGSLPRVHPPSPSSEQRVAPPSRAADRPERRSVACADTSSATRQRTTRSPTGRGSPRIALRRERGTGEHSAERRGEGSR